MNSYKTLSLYLLLATPVLSIAQRSSTAPDIDTTTNKMDDPNGLYEFMHKSERTNNTKEEKQNGAEILQQAGMPKLFGKKQTKQKTSDSEKRRIENKIFEKRTKIETLTKEIESLHAANCFYVTIKPDITSQLERAKQAVEESDRFLGEYQALEERNLNYRNAAALVATVNGAAYLAAKVGFRPIEQAVERIPYSDVIMAVVELIAIGCGCLANRDYKDSHKYAQETKEELETNSAHLATLKQAASQLEEKEAQITKLENELKELNVDLVNLK